MADVNQSVTVDEAYSDTTTITSTVAVGAEKTHVVKDLDAVAGTDKGIS